MLVLGIESSCDETSASVVRDGRFVLSNIISSQIEIHKKFGGVVPEVASRNHLMCISNVVDEALNAAKVKLSDIDAIAVTYGAGLIGALLVGVNFAKSLASAIKKPLIKVNHIRGHIAANYIFDKNLKPPFTALVVSGGHTAVLEIKNYITQKKLFSTVDDAIGEAFDKVAKVLGLSYPGGPNIERLAGGESAENIFNYRLNDNKKGFSYSGLKTATINYIHNLEQGGKKVNKQLVAQSFQTLACQQVAQKSSYFASKGKGKTLVVCGGVSANMFLRKMLKNECDKYGVKLIVPPLEYCTDNAAMVASEGYFQFIHKKNIAKSDLNAKSTLEL